MSKSSYLGANVVASGDTFSGWINKTNQIIYDLGTVVVTTSAVAQPNATNGGLTSGNAQIQGIFSANTVAVIDGLRGGTTSTPAPLNIVSNTNWSGVGNVHIGTTTLHANTGTFNVTGNVSINTGTAKLFYLNSPTATINGAAYNLNVNVFTQTSNTAIINTQTLTATGNTVFNGGFAKINNASFIVTGANTSITNTVRADVVAPTINLTGNITATGLNTTVTSNTTTISGNNTVVNSNTSVSGAILSINSTNTNITSTVGITGPTTISGRTIVTGNTTINGNTDIQGNVTTNGSSVSVTAPVITVNGDVSSTGGFNITAPDGKIVSVVTPVATINATSIVAYANTTIVGTTTISGPTTISGSNTVISSANTNITSSGTNITGVVRVGGSSFNVNSTNTNISSTVSVTGNTNVTGNTVIKGNVTTNSATFIANTTTLGLYGNTTIGGLNATINANTATVSSNNLTFNAPTTVNGNTNLNGPVITISANNTNVTGNNFNVNSNTSIAGSNFVVSSATTDITSNVSVTGVMKISGQTHVSGTSFVANTASTLINSDITLNAPATKSVTLTGPVTNINTANTNINGTLNINANTVMSGAGSLTINYPNVFSTSNVITTGDLTANNVTVSGTLTVSGGSSTSVTVENMNVMGKTIALNDGASKTDATANGGGIVLKGTIDKAWLWIDATDSWTSSESVDVASNRSYKIGGNDVITSTTIGSGITESSLKTLGTVTSGVWNATTIAVNRGGTGQTSYSNGQILIGSGTGLAKGTIAGGQNVTVTLGAGTISIAASNTDISTTSNATNVSVVSSTGTNADLPLANSTNAGIISSGDKTKLDGIAPNAIATVPLSATGNTTTVTVGSTAPGSNATIAAANSTIAGVMTSADRIKLDSVAANAIASVPLVKTGNTTTVTVGSSAPGSNAIITAANSTVAGILTSADKAKLDGIEAGAQVNLPTNLSTTHYLNSVSIVSSTGTNTAIMAANSTVAGILTSADKGKLDGIEAGAQVNVPTNLSTTYAAGSVSIVSSTGTNTSIAAANTTAAGIVTTGAQTIAGAKTFTSAISADVSGNAATATKLATARTINGVSFDGTENIDIPSIRVGGIALVTGSVATDGDTYFNITRQVGYAHLGVLSAATDADIRIVPKGAGNTRIYGDSIYMFGTPRLYNGTAYYSINSLASASRTLTLPDSNVTLVGGTMVPTTGAGASGTWGIDISGNASTATKLATARTINGVSFDGTKNITITDGSSLNSLNASNLSTGTISDARLPSTMSAKTINDSINVMGTVVSLNSDASQAYYFRSAAGTIRAATYFDAPSGNVSLRTYNTSGAHTSSAVLTTTGTFQSNIFDAGIRFEGKPDDTAAAPSYTWTGDTNTGMYRPATDVIAFATSGTERGRINSTGFSGNGSQLTSLNASALTSGTIPSARLPSNLATTDSGNNLTGSQVINNGFIYLKSDALRTIHFQKLDGTPQSYIQSHTDGRFVIYNYNAAGTAAVGSLAITASGVVEASVGFSGNGSQLTALNASALTSGTIADARLPATMTGIFNGTHQGNGAGLTSLPAGQLTGSVPTAALGNVPNEIATRGAGEIGTYALLKYTGSTEITVGGTVSGSALFYTGASGDASVGSPSGTWRSMGRIYLSSSGDRTTVWLRIA